MEMKRPSVILDSAWTPPGYVDVPFGENSRMWEVIIYNRRGDQISGTFTIWRLRKLLERLKKRYPASHASTPTPQRSTVTVRKRKFGPVVAMIKPIVVPARKN